VRPLRRKGCFAPIGDIPDCDPYEPTMKRSGFSGPSPGLCYAEETMPGSSPSALGAIRFCRGEACRRRRPLRRWDEDSRDNNSAGASITAFTLFEVSHPPIYGRWPCRAGSNPNSRSWSKRRRPARDGCTRSNSTAFGWPRGSNAARCNFSRAPDSTGRPNIQPRRFCCNDEV
jgi:hypothetical protein